MAQGARSISIQRQPGQSPTQIPTQNKTSDKVGQSHETCNTFITRVSMAIYTNLADFISQ
jgi:hypothetical protein